MKRVLLDTNVVLDVLLDRTPHATASSSVWAAIEGKLAEGFLAAHAVTTIHYLVRKESGQTQAKHVLAAILSVFRVAPVDGQVLQDALRFTAPDFEDCVTAAAAKRVGCDFVITRDPKGFRESPIRAVTPEIASALMIATRPAT